MPAASIVLGTTVPETRLVGRWHAQIYREAFRRLGIALRLEVYPTQRLSVSADQGLVDGETARAYEYQQDHPNLIRVEEPLVNAMFALYAVSPDIKPSHLSELRGTRWRAVYSRGVAVCAKSLASALPAEQITDVTDSSQAWNMVLSGRAEIICTSVLTADDVFRSAEFKGRAEARKVLDLSSTPLHGYLHRKHAALAPQLAQVLKKMKAEGLIERYRLEVFGSAASAASAR